MLCCVYVAPFIVVCCCANLFLISFGLLESHSSAILRYGRMELKQSQFLYHHLLHGVRVVSRIFVPLTDYLYGIFRKPISLLLFVFCCLLSTAQVNRIRFDLNGARCTFCLSFDELKYIYFFSQLKCIQTVKSKMANR